MAGKVKGKKKWKDTQYPKHKPKNLSVPHLRAKQANLCPEERKTHSHRGGRIKTMTVDLTSLNKAGNQFQICCGRTI